MPPEFEPLVESAASEEAQAKAEKLGWIPPTRFKGDPERFIDAEEYLERGETVLPIVKEQNRRLHAELEAVRTESVKTAAALKAAQDAIDQIEERHTVATQKAVEQARAQVKAQLAAASEAGDHEGVAELTDQLTQLNVTEAEAPAKKAPAPEAPASFTPPPELAEWNAENPWFGTDKRKTALALGIAQELREGGESSTGRRFFEKVAAEMEAMFESKEHPVSKVEGARNGSDADRPAGARKGFAALPADAKAACDSDQRQFVGPGKRYKTVAEWRTRYAELYFEGS